MVNNDVSMEMIKTAIDDVQNENKDIDISEEQREAVLTFFCSEFRFVFLTGGAGTGKSTVIRFFLMVCRRLGYFVLKTATTGIAALLIGGQTLHQALGVSADIVEFGIETREATPLFRSAVYIIIDEVSMMTADIFRILENCLRTKQKAILSGDFAQIGPVLKKMDNSMQGTFSTKLFAFIREQMEVVVLKKVHRQSDSKDFEILEKIRRGIFVPELKDFVKEEYDLTGKTDENMNKIAEELIEAQKAGRKIYFLSFKNATCEKINTACQKILTSDPEAYRTYEPEEIPMEDIDDIHILAPATKKMLKEQIEQSKKDAKQEHKNITLCEGQKVMISINEKLSSLDEHRKYVNGSIGVVTAMNEDTVTVCLDDGEEVEIKRAKDDRKVLYLGEDKKPKLYIYQRIRYMPIIGANAITIHKSQGQTMEKIFLDPRGCKQPGLIYTALSRVKKLEDVVLVAPIEKENVVVDRHVKAYYDFIDLEGRSYDLHELMYLEERMKAIDSYIDAYEEATDILQAGIPELIGLIEKKRYDENIRKGDLTVWEIGRMMLFNRLYDLPDDFKDPRLPYAVEAAIDDKNGPILEAWVNGVFDDVLDIEAYGMSLLEQPKVQLTKEEAVFELFAGDMQAGVYDDDRLDEYVDEHLDEYMENLDEYLDEYTYAYLEANKLAFPEFDEKDL